MFWGRVFSHLLAVMVSCSQRRLDIVVRAIVVREHYESMDAKWQRKDVLGTQW